jgi:hypothetical protein
LGSLIAQRRFFHTDRCLQTFEQIRDNQWKDLTPTQRARGEEAPEKPLKKNVDLVDAAQYCATQYVIPAKPKEREVSASDELSAWAWQAAKKKRAARAQRRHDLGGIVV